MDSFPPRRSPLLVLAAALVAVVAAPTPHSYGYSVINRQGQVFSIILTPLFLSLAHKGSAPTVVAQPMARGQRVMGSSLTTAGIYDNPAGASVPLSGAPQAPAQTGPVGVSIHYN